MSIVVQEAPLYKVVVSSSTYTVNVTEPAPLNVVIRGVNAYRLVLTQTILQGPKGDKGDPGNSTGGDLTYTHNQMIAASTWTVNHNLGKYPAVTVVDSAGDHVLANINYPDTATVIITFSSSNAGKAFLN
jgi:hypothetical protein